MGYKPELDSTNIEFIPPECHCQTYVRERVLPCAYDDSYNCSHFSVSRGREPKKAIFHQCQASQGFDNWSGVKYSSHSFVETFEN